MSGGTYQHSLVGQYVCGLVDRNKMYFSWIAFDIYLTSGVLNREPHNVFLLL